MIPTKIRFCQLVFVIVLLSTVDNFCQGEKLRTNTYVVFRIDDFGVDDFSIYDRLFKIFSKHSSSLTIGIVPFGNSKESLFTNMSPDKIALVKNNQSIIELALHGFTHKDRNPSKITSEFAGIDSVTQYRMIKSGKHIIDSIFNYRTSVFIPPWNSYDEKTISILEQLGFSVLSAAPYGAISSPKSEIISYIPYTIELDRFISKYEDEFLPPGLYVVMIHDYLFTEAKSSAGYKRNSEQKISLGQLDCFLNTLSKSPSVKITSFSELAMGSMQFDSSRLMNNLYFDEIIPVFDFLKLRNDIYLENDELNYIRNYNQLVGLLLYLGMLVIGYMVYRFYINCLSVHSRLLPSKKMIQLLMIMSSMFLTILVLKSYSPTYLAFFFFFSGITVAIIHEYVSIYWHNFHFSLIRKR